MEICCGEAHTSQLSPDLHFTSDGFILKDCHQVAELQTAALGSVDDTTMFGTVEPQIHHRLK